MDQSVFERIRNDIESGDVVLFMKGTPIFPQCSGSAQAVQILGMLGVKYKSIDVLANPSVRQGIKDYSNWPKLPQLFIKGVFIGDNDILAEMCETGEFQKLLVERNIPTNPS